MSLRALPFLLAAVAVASHAFVALAQEEELEPEPAITAANGKIVVEGQVQPQASSSTVDTVTNFDSELRRARFTVDGDAGGGFGGRIQVDFGGERARIRDAYAEYKPSKAVTIRAGQFKIPFNGIELVSSKRLLLIERGNRIRGLRRPATSDFLADVRYSARNRGVMGIVKLPGGRATLQAGGWLGSGEGPETDDGKEFAARFEYSVLELPEETSKPLVVGVAAVTNGYFGEPRDTLRVVSGDTLFVEDPQYGAAYEGWVEYGAYLLPGLHVAANVVTGDNPLALTAEGEDLELQTFLGLQGWMEYLLETGAEILTGVAPAFRADRFDPDSDADDDANVFVTPGVNLYFGSNVKAQLNYDVSIPQDDDLDTESAFRAQAQVLF